MSGYVPPSRPVGLRLLVEPRIPQPEGVRECQFYKFMATRYAVAFGTALEPTSRENQKKEVENIDDNIIFLKNSFLNHFKNLKDPRIDRSKDHLVTSPVG